MENEVEQTVDKRTQGKEVPDPESFDSFICVLFLDEHGHNVDKEQGFQAPDSYMPNFVDDLTPHTETTVLGLFLY